MACRSSLAETTGKSSVSTQASSTAERNRPMAGDPSAGADWIVFFSSHAAGSASASQKRLRSSSIYDYGNEVPMLPDPLQRQPGLRLVRISKKPCCWRRATAGRVPNSQPLTRYGLAPTSEADRPKRLTNAQPSQLEILCRSDGATFPRGTTHDTMQSIRRHWSCPLCRRCRKLVRERSLGSRSNTYSPGRCRSLRSQRNNRSCRIARSDRYTSPC